MDLALARRLVTSPAAGPGLRWLAWCALKSASGHPVRQSALPRPVRP